MACPPSLVLAYNRGIEPRGELLNAGVGPVHRSASTESNSGRSARSVASSKEHHELAVSRKRARERSGVRRIDVPGARVVRNRP